MAMTNPETGDGEIANAEVWRAVEALASAWRNSPAVRDFARELPRNSAQRSLGLSGLLQEVAASASPFFQHPLLLGSKLRWAAGQLPGVDSESLAQYPSWLDAADRVEFAARLTVAWVRSRLPRYPQLLAPELAPGGPLTTDEFTFDIVWRREDRKRGMQLRNPPPDIGAALQADDLLGPALESATRSLASRLRATEEWTRFGVATESLQDSDREELRAVWRGAKRRLAPAEIDAYEPNLAMRRAEYRRAVVDESTESLSGASRDYASAFSAANSMVDRAVVDVLGQLACFEVRTLRVQNVEVSPGPPRAVRFEAADDDIEVVLLRPGELAWLDDSVVRDAVFVTGTSFSWSGTGTSTTTFDGELLSGSATAWRDSS